MIACAQEGSRRGIKRALQVSLRLIHRTVCYGKACNTPSQGIGWRSAPLIGALDSPIVKKDGTSKIAEKMPSHSYGRRRTVLLVTLAVCMAVELENHLNSENTGRQPAGDHISSRETGVRGYQSLLFWILQFSRYYSGVINRESLTQPSNKGCRADTDHRVPLGL